MKELENKLNVMLENTENAHRQLQQYNQTFRQLYARLEEISVQYKRKTPITDASFEQDFRQAVEQLMALSDGSSVFWKEIRKKYHSKYNKLIDGEHRLLIKKISICALVFTRQTDELFTIYKNLHSLGKDLPLRLNWWMLETSIQDLLKTTSRILFLMRSMEKHYV